MAGAKGKSGRKANERPFRHMLLQKLDEIDPNSERKKMNAIAEALIEEAIKGEAWAVKEIMDRVDGKPHQAVHGAGEDGEHIIKAYGWLPVQE